jgi:hypothetical protein
MTMTDLDFGNTPKFEKIFGTARQAFDFRAVQCRSRCRLPTPVNSE